MVFRLGYRKFSLKIVQNVLYSSNISKMSTNIPQFEHLSVSVPKEFVYHVELNRTDKLNAMNNAMFKEITRCFETLSDSEDCRVVVLSGSGKIFCAGIDLKDFAQNSLPAVALIEDPARKAKLLYQLCTLYQKSMSSLEHCKKPVIAAIHGACIGGGVDLVTAADVRHCTKDAYFVVKEADVGLAADIGSLQRLPKVIGSDSLARELCYTCRKFPADEALTSGLVSKVYNDKDTMIESVINIAEDIAKKSPVAIQTTKASLVFSRDHTVEEGLEHIALLNQLMLQSEDLATAATGQLMKDSNIQFSKL
ncbi:delta(3,5)-Delta(2,4)-dienoyl-CoA isomerase, mitochondrial isoform X1 [Sitophilus oryzae]|uniref:Delta(3,5)-Delta(2,4)-dienoyl-CoA isomerase, mitochondrial n=2 Tax=Sitophilus oryzae TaxID=7048 RepID=A0A6J2X4P9_SITOR|nr:delta(3,5)-Delta(2,4)-dienoyl-CoA isomerase, mitochondrial isoform X1 [Sitophilus oryzae]